MTRSIIIALAIALAACGSEPDAAAVVEEEQPVEVATLEPTEAPPTVAPTEAPPPTPAGATRANPVPAGELWTFATDAWTMTFGPLEVLTGADATARLKSVNQFNDDPGAGNMHVLANVVVKVEGDAVPEAFETFDQEFWAVVANGRPFDGSKFSSMVMPEPEFDGETIPPGELSGWIFFEVPETEDAQLVFLRALDNGGFWFSLD